jgi:hypothetical protein
MIMNKRLVVVIMVVLVALGSVGIVGCSNEDSLNVLVATETAGTIEDLGHSISEEVEIVSRIEGAGYSTPEEAVRAYIEAFKNADVATMISTFAVETAVANYDLKAQLERLRSFNPHIGQALPASNPFTSDINIYRRQGDIARGIGLQYMAIFMSDHEGNGFHSMPTHLPNEQDIDEFMSRLDDPAYMDSISTMRLIEVVPGSRVSELYTSEQNQEFLQKQSRIIGADRIESIVALVEIEYTAMNNAFSAELERNIADLTHEELIEAEHVMANNHIAMFCFDTAQYGGRWYIHSFSGNIGMLLGMEIIAHGARILLPYTSEVIKGWDDLSKMGFWK